MFETRWVDRLKSDHPNADFLFVAEGVFLCLVKQEVNDILMSEYY